jgi:hypothetical protein
MLRERVIRMKDAAVVDLLNNCHYHIRTLWAGGQCQRKNHSENVQLIR